MEKTETWLRDVMEELGWDKPERAYHALRAVLHALRDRLPVEEAVDLGSQLPMLIRGFYYDGWSLSGKPVRERKKAEFLAHVSDAFRGDWEVDPEFVTRAVFKVIEKYVSSGEIEDVKSNLPVEIRNLWL